MKRKPMSYILAKLLLALVFFAYYPHTAQAQEYQNTPVTISKEKVKINGQVCYSHVVLEKQTLFSICKVYNVTLEDIYKYNPRVKEEGLKKNSILIIPMYEKLAEKDPQRKEAEKKEQAVKPERKTSEKAEAKKDEVKEDNRIRHTLKWYEDINIIAKKYGVTAEAIMKENGLSSKRLKKRQVLIIPIPAETAEEVETEEETEPVRNVDEPVQDADSTAVADSLANDETEEDFEEWLFPAKKEIELSLLLPLKATGTTSSRQNMDFYSGVLLAVYDLQTEGITTNLNVFDIAGGNIPYDDPALSRSDLIVGPVASGDISRLLSSNRNVTAVVSPLDPRAEDLAYTESALIQAPTPQSAVYHDIVSWLKDELNPEDKVIFITEKGARYNETVTKMTAAIDSADVEYTNLSYSILEGRDVSETLKSMMTEYGSNRVFIASESEAFVNDVVRNLNVMIHQKYNVVLYAASKIRSFETIEVENFHNCSMRVSTGYYIDYKDTKVMEFLLRYRALYNTEPSQFAFQGYDIAKYFISHRYKYGNRWMKKLSADDADMLQSSFRFENTPNGGYINTAVRRILYDTDWTVRKLR